MSTKAPPIKRFGMPMLGQQTPLPSAVPQACATPPQPRSGQDYRRPSGSPGASRALQMARQWAQIPAGSGNAPELAQSCLGTAASHRCAHTKAYGNSPGRRRLSAVVLAIYITQRSCNALSSPLPSHTRRAFAITPLSAL